MNASDQPVDFTHLDDSALLAWRAETRAELEQLSSASPGHAALAALYDQSTHEINDRTRSAWPQTNSGAGTMNDTTDTADAVAVIRALPPKTAKMLAVEILLADPESLADDVLEACLYLLRERLQEA